MRTLIRCALISSLLVFCSGQLRSEEEKAKDANADKPAVITEKEKEAAAEGSSVEQLTERARKSLATITFLGRDGKQEGMGTGFVISPDGLIATNRHVLGEARPLKVQLADGRKFDVQSVHASDRLMDLAIVKIDAKDLTPLPLGDSDKIKQGQQVVALGNPLGLKYSVVSGVVSGMREREGRPMIQLAIPIEPGNSGGPLVDMQGRVLGIMTMKSVVTANLGFAMTINSLKPLLAKPNPILLNRWLTIGALDSREWQPLFGGSWRQRAGHIHVEGAGGGFGGRTLCLWKGESPAVPYELAVTVKMDDEGGAAGLIFGADGQDRHWGFYPSAGKMRVSRFEGPDVLSWNVLFDQSSEHYHSGDWNRLRVRVEKDKLTCFVNDQRVVEMKHDDFAGTQVGLAKFRQTKAEYKQFRVGDKLQDAGPDQEELAKLVKLVETAAAKPATEMAKNLAPHADQSIVLLQAKAAALEREARQLKQLAEDVHAARVIADMLKLFDEPEEKIDLFHAGLLIARLDNDEVDVEAYRTELKRLGRELSDSIVKDASEADKLKTLGKFLFEENGFHGSRADYYNKANSYLNEVLDDREGLPITLSVLYIALAREIGLDVVGIGLPGHFVVQHRPKEGEPQLIDVYEDAKLLSREAANQQVQASADRPLTDEDLKPATKRSIVLRMIRNLMNIAGQTGDATTVLRYLNLTLALEPNTPQDRWMRAIVGYQLKRPDVAITDLDWLQQKQPAGIDVHRVQELRELVERLSK